METRGSGTRKTTGNTEAGSIENTEDAINPQNEGTSVKTRKINAENKQARKRKAEGNQGKHRLTRGKPANSGELWAKQRKQRDNRGNDK